MAFKKLVTNLSFSPSLIGEVALYAKKLKKETRLRFIGVCTAIIAFALQLFIIWSPPEPINTAHPSNIIYGGIQSKQDFLQRYKHNEASLQAIMSALHIQPSEIHSLQEKQQSITPSAYRYRIARTPLTSTNTPHFTLTYASSQKVVINSTNNLPTTDILLSGTSAMVGHFAILQHSGDIVVEKAPIDSEASLPNDVTVATSVHNDTLSQPANPHTPLAPNTRLVYTLTAHNTSSEPLSFALTDNLSDIREYADIIDIGTGILDDKKTTIHWPINQLQPGKKTQRSFTIRVKSRIPTTASNKSNPDSYDCKINNTTGERSPLTVQCPLVKTIATPLANLPSVHNNLILLGSTCLLLLTIYHHARAKQRMEEVRLLRHNINQGTLL